MAKFLTTNGISYEIENIIKNSKKELYLVTPYLQISKNLYERLKDADKKRIRITIIYGKSELTIHDQELLENLENLEIFYFENLHAKCYFNESEMVITSMNMYEYSEKNNREMGIYISRARDFDLFKNAKDETLSIIDNAELDTNNSNSSTLQNTNHGFCIRCNDHININIEKPYCDKCYSIWLEYSNSEYPENFCHKCGNTNESNMYYPMHYDCYKSYNTL